MDEPTNDLDAETLELLEDLVTNYQGTLLFVSHDRAFLNNVVTSTIVFDDDGQLREYVGGYDDWQRQRAIDKKPVMKKEKPAKPQATSAKPKLSYQEKQKLEKLPVQIAEIEASQTALHDQMAQADFYQQGAENIAQVQSELTALEAKLSVAYAEWETLDAKQ